MAAKESPAFAKYVTRQVTECLWNIKPIEAFSQFLARAYIEAKDAMHLWHCIYAAMRIHDWITCNYQAQAIDNMRQFVVFRYVDYIVVIPYIKTRRQGFGKPAKPKSLNS